MSQSHYMRTILDLKDKNITFPDFRCEEKRINGRLSKVFYGILSYTPHRCANCGMEKEDFSIIRHGFKKSRLTMNSTSHYPTYLMLKKQRFYCKRCDSTFCAETTDVERHCFIANTVKHSIAVEAKDKISEKDLARRHHVSPTTTSRVIQKMAAQFRLALHSLPKHLSFDEFHSVQKQMSFIYINAVSHEVIDVLPDRRLDTLRSHFNRYTQETRAGVETIVIDMNTPYLTLIHELFPHAKIIIDPFHFVQLVSRSLNQTRDKVMNGYRTSRSEDLKKYRKLKRYWRLGLKREADLNPFDYSYQRLFKGMKSQTGIMTYLLALDEEYKTTYDFYQDILYAYDQKDFTLFQETLAKAPKGLSSYMRTSVRTLKKYCAYVENTFLYPYTNGPIEGINNKIKVIKRIAFGFRSFSKFKTRVLISCNTIQK